MGAVRVRVKLTNAIDRKLVNRGLLNPNLLRSYETQALVDTGSSSLVIPMDVADCLGLNIVDQQLAKYADAREEAISLTEDLLVELLEKRILQSALVTGYEVLIGQSVLEGLNFLVDCQNERLLPNPAIPKELG